ncbi:MAG: cytochrome c biogenesis protein ResB [Deltaproteobacteria bacterium]|jgi:cytochrome c biogenesis protein|nr:cytochrome c biogenesis protein ResB [Deltaproteobacteria bacterium]
MNTIFLALRSLRLSVAVSVYMAVLCIIGALNPALEVTKSIPFLVGGAVFFINLLTCTIFRFLRELGKKSGRNFGPDIHHAALLAFIIGACLSSFLKIDLTIWLFEGQHVELPNGCTVTADALAAEKYDDGRPKQWLTAMTVTKGGQRLADGYALRVNHPLTVDGMTLYQYSWGVSESGSTYTVIRAVYDPAIPIVFTSLILFGLGTWLTLFTKFRRPAVMIDC